MPTRAVKPQREDTMLSGWQSQPETAPSIVQEEQPSVARFLALVGLVLVSLGVFATMVAPAIGRAYFIGPGLGMVSLSLGLFFLIFHALTDRDVQYRLMYLILGYVAIGGGLALRVLPFGGSVGALFLSGGIPGAVLGLIFVLAAIRHETDAKTRFTLTVPLGIIGFAMVVLAGLAGFINQTFLMNEGVLISLVGLLFIAAFIGNLGYGNEVGYRAGLTLGAIGAFGLFWAVARSLMSSTPFFVPGGLVLITLSLVYLLIAASVCTDWPVLVILRRELKAFFFSPIAYLVMLGNVALAWIWFAIFLVIVRRQSTPVAGGMAEPIVHPYMFNILLFVALLFIIPIFTMRLFSEEKRSGTLEVLLTAPVSELSIVLGKFFSTLIVYLISWLPWFGFLIALRIYGGTDFEYRPLLSFLPVMIVTGMAWLSFGLFFSATTSNQVIAAVLTFVVMILQYMPNIAKFMFQVPETSLWHDILTYISPLDLWETSLYGTLSPRSLLYYVSITVFFLFLTTKLLEARKWK